MIEMKPVGVALCAGLVSACGFAGAARGDIVQSLLTQSTTLSGVEFGQTFTAEGGEIASISVGLKDANAFFGVFEITVDLHEGVLGTLLDTHTMVLPENLPHTLVAFDFAGNDLTAGEVYSFTVTSTSGRGFISINQHSFPNGNPNNVDYTGGDMLSNGTENEIFDLQFAVAQAPEPGSLALLGLGGLALLRRRR